MSDREIDVVLLQNGNKISNVYGKIKISEILEILHHPNENPPAGFGIFRIITQKDGDKRIIWDKRDFAQITEAKDMFNQCVLQGLIPYRVGINGKATVEVMDEFDPHAEEVIFLPVAMVVGG